MKKDSRFIWHKTIVLNKWKAKTNVEIEFKCNSCKFKHMYHKPLCTNSKNEKESEKHGHEHEPSCIN
jgi:hypothetical protein